MSEKTFTQNEVDEIVQERLRRFKRQLERELEETRAEISADTPDYKKQYFDNLRKIKLIDAGMTYDQAERYVKYIDGATEKEIEAQAIELAADVLTKKERTYADPSGKRKGIWNPFS